MVMFMFATFFVVHISLNAYWGSFGCGAYLPRPFCLLNSARAQAHRCQMPKPTIKTALMKTCTSPMARLMPKKERTGRMRATRETIRCATPVPVLLTHQAD